MLTAIEARLEDTIAAAALQPPEAVHATERAREQERRRVCSYHIFKTCW